jgi:hypothetical protein
VVPRLRRCWVTLSASRIERSIVQPVPPDMPGPMVTSRCQAQVCPTGMTTSEGKACISGILLTRRCR